MKLPFKTASSIQQEQAGESATVIEQRLRNKVRRLGTPRKALGLAALTAGIGAGTFMSFSPASSPASHSPPASQGTAPQVRVLGNKLVGANGQPVSLHGVDRSGTEFMCVQGHGVFDGPDTMASVKVMKTYGINAVRIPLNEACWNGGSYVTPGAGGASYQRAIQSYVRRVNSQGMVAILDLHWTNGAYTGPASACSSSEATCQKPMPDAAGSIRFWKSVATAFKGNDSVIFDLFNEPYPEQAAKGNLAAGWKCWLHGGADCAGIPYQVAGMQTLVNAVRSTGANNVIMLGGLTWSNDLSQWLSHKPTDPDHNLAASWHSYNFNGCNTKSCWTSQIAPVLAKVPVIAGEIGENDCASSYVTRLTRWLDSKGASYLAWTWNKDFNCATGPGLITSYGGHPTGFGAGYEAHLRSLAHN